MTLQAVTVFFTKINVSQPAIEKPSTDPDIPQDICEESSSIAVQDDSDAVLYAQDLDLEKSIEELSALEPVKIVKQKSWKKKRDPSTKAKGLGAYYTSISKIEPLTRQQEVEVFEEYFKVRKTLRATNDTDPSLVPLKKKLLDIRNEIVSRNCRFVLKLARTFWVDGNLENFENIVSAGNIGLIRAVDKFDHTRGTRFLSYAAHWIALEIRNEISTSTLVKVPVWWQKTLKRLNEAQRELEKEEAAVSRDDLATRANIPLRLLVKAERSRQLNMNHYPFSQLDIHSTDTDQLITSSASVEKEFFITDTKKKLNEILVDIESKLTRGRTRTPSKFNAVDAVKSVFGLEDGAPQNLRQISNITSICSERVRQLKEEGLRHLKKQLVLRGIRSTHDIL